MPSDPQLQAALDRILAGVRTQLESGLRVYGEELTRAAAAERARAVEVATEDIRRQAHEQLAQLRDAARKQHDDLRRSAETQIGELRRLLEDLRKNAQQQIETARRTLETEVAAARAKADAEVDEARRHAASRADEVQRTMDARVAGMQRALDAAQREAASLRQQLQDTQTRAAQAAADHGTRLADGMRSLDESRSLGDALERLVQSAVRACDRAALLMLRGESLRSWRLVGFEHPPAGRRELPAAEAGIAGTAAREGRLLTVSGEGQLPPFAAAPRPHEAAAFPITVAGAVVAVLYADVARPRGDARVWTADLEMLSRHAGRVLEAITIQQAAGLRPVGPVARPSQSTSSAPDAAGNGPSEPGASGGRSRLGGWS